MNCNQVRTALVAYLDGEGTPETRKEIAEHLAICAECRQACTSLVAIQESTRQGLQTLAAYAEPSPQAWERIRAGIAKSAPPSQHSLRAWLASHFAWNPLLEGEILMKKKMFAPIVVAFAVILTTALVLSQHIPTVSAQQILDRAYAAQTAPAPTEGIEHTRTEIYSNVQAQTGVNAGSRAIIESYLDIKSGKYRTLVTDEASGQLIDLSAFDGTYIYYLQTDAAASDPVTIYRTPLANMVTTKEETTQYPAQTAEQQFNQFRSNPNVTLVGKQTWTDGSEVYVLKSQQPVKIMVEGQVQIPEGTSTMTFDANTYAMLENKVTVKLDGQDVTVMQNRYLADEILPADTAVAWDLSDLKGISIKDLPVSQAQPGNLPPVTIDQDELAKHNAYVLSSIPSGFDKEISAAPGQDPSQPYAYVISYRNQADDYFEIQSASETADMLGNIYNAEVYTTVSGLELHFAQSDTAPDGKTITSFFFTAPDGLNYSVTSSLPLDQVKQLAEELVQSK